MTAEAFWDRIAPRYARKAIGDPDAYEAKLTRLAAILQPTDRVLEIGCGTGGTALRLAASVGHVTGADVSGAMIDIARSKLGPDAPANVDFVKADAAAAVDGAPFDAICAFSLLHLVDDVPNVLAAVRDRLRPGGVFISKTVCLKDGSPLLRPLIRVLTAVGIAPDVAVLGAEDLRRQIDAAGFAIETVEWFDKKRMSPFIVARRTDA